ncbi:MAG: hypothetical protein V2A66_09950 [Pseudomonadota bacterium]
MKICSDMPELECLGELQGDYDSLHRQLDELSSRHDSYLGEHTSPIRWGAEKFSNSAKYRDTYDHDFNAAQALLRDYKTRINTAPMAELEELVRKARTYTENAAYYWNSYMRWTEAGADPVQMSPFYLIPIIGTLVAIGSKKIGRDKVDSLNSEVNEQIDWKSGEGLDEEKLASVARTALREWRADRKLQHDTARFGIAAEVAHTTPKSLVGEYLAALFERLEKEAGPARDAFAKGVPVERVIREQILARDVYPNYRQVYDRDYGQSRNCFEGTGCNCDGERDVILLKMAFAGINTSGLSIARYRDHAPAVIYDEKNRTVWDLRDNETNPLDPCYPRIYDAHVKYDAFLEMRGEDSPVVEKDELVIADPSRLGACSEQTVSKQRPRQSDAIATGTIYAFPPGARDYSDENTIEKYASYNPFEKGKAPAIPTPLIAFGNKQDDERPRVDVFLKLSKPEQIKALVESLDSFPDMIGSSFVVPSVMNRFGWGGLVFRTQEMADYYTSLPPEKRESFFLKLLRDGVNRSIDPAGIETALSFLDNPGSGRRIPEKEFREMIVSMMKFLCAILNGRRMAPDYVKLDSPYTYSDDSIAVWGIYDEILCGMNPIAAKLGRSLDNWVGKISGDTRRWVKKVDSLGAQKRRMYLKLFNLVLSMRSHRRSIDEKIRNTDVRWISRRREGQRPPSEKVKYTVPVTVTPTPISTAAREAPPYDGPIFVEPATYIDLLQFSGFKDYSRYIYRKELMALFSEENASGAYDGLLFPLLCSAVYYNRPKVSPILDVCKQNFPLGANPPLPAFTWPPIKDMEKRFGEIQRTGKKPPGWSDDPLLRYYGEKVIYEYYRHDGASRKPRR